MVWHDYELDQHILLNYQITSNGFASGTMHVAHIVASTHIWYSNNALSIRYLNGNKRSMMQCPCRRQQIINGIDRNNPNVPSTIDLHGMDEQRKSWFQYRTRHSKQMPLSVSPPFVPPCIVEQSHTRTLFSASTIHPNCDASNGHCFSLPSPTSTYSFTYIFYTYIYLFYLAPLSDAISNI